MALREEKEFVISGKQKGSVREEGGQSSFRHDGHERAKPTPKTAPSSEPPTPRGRSGSRRRSHRGRVRLGRPIDSRACNSCKVLAPNYLVTDGILPNINSLSLNRCVNSAESAHFRTGRAEKGWWQKFSSYCKRCTTVQWCITGHRAARICSDFLEGPRSFGTNSTSTIHEGCTASSKHPRKYRSIVWENTTQNSSSAKSLRHEVWGQISRRDRKTRAMRPQRRVETCQEYLISSKRKTKLHSVRLPMSGFCQPHPQ